MLATYDGNPVRASDSASIVLLRAGELGTEIYLMRRRRSMDFASGMHVFPGGGVQASDFESTPWLGPAPHEWAQALGCESSLAHALVVAAVRETFEETGVLLAGADLGSLADPLPDDVRDGVEQHRLPFGQVLAERGLAMRTDLIAPWAHWVTPEFEPRRFDTRFFVCVMPGGLDVDTVAAEADQADWRFVDEAVDEARAGTVAMLAPTLHVCRQLSEEALGGLPAAGWSRTIAPVMPRVVEIEGRRYLDSPRPDEL